MLYSAAFWTIFLSTPSARRATSLLPFTAPPVSYFYPRPPRGGRRGGVFLSAVCAGISIHALREEGDVSGSSMLSRSPNFYPRPPRGGRLKLISFKATLYRFLSTPSARRATIISNNSYGLLRFLSTPSARRATASPRPLPRMESAFLSTPSARRATTKKIQATTEGSNFYPRPPRGGRPLRAEPTVNATNFYPRPPRGGRRSSTRSSTKSTIFLSTPSARRATAQQFRPAHPGADFYPRPPRGGRL